MTTFRIHPSFISQIFLIIIQTSGIIYAHINIFMFFSKTRKGLSPSNSFHRMANWDCVRAKCGFAPTLTTPLPPTRTYPARRRGWTSKRETSCTLCLKMMLIGMIICSFCPSNHYTLHCYMECHSPLSRHAFLVTSAIHTYSPIFNVAL